MKYLTCFIKKLQLLQRLSTGDSTGHFESAFRVCITAQFIT